MLSFATGSEGGMGPVMTSLYNDVRAIQVRDQSTGNRIDLNQMTVMFC